MNKKQLHHLWVKIRPLSYWYFLAGFILFGLIALSSLRANNLTMIRLRDAVIQADKEGTDVNKPLDDLRRFVYSHMNTDLTSGDTAIRPPIQLKETYERLVTAERNRVREINNRVNREATVICERRFPAGRLANGRVQCVQNYVTTHGVKEKEIPKELYQFDFVSPVWSPDLAGWSLILSAVFLMLFAVRFGLERWLHSRLD